jgi:hypothetical protein
MRLRFFLMVGALLLVIGFMPYLLHNAAKPRTFIVGAYETTLSWTDGPDVELSASSLKTLDEEIAEFVRPQMNSAKSPFSVISLGKHRAEVMAMAADVPSSQLNTKVVAFVQARLGKLASQQ